MLLVIAGTTTTGSEPTKSISYSPMDILKPLMMAAMGMGLNLLLLGLLYLQLVLPLVLSLLQQEKQLNQLDSIPLLLPPLLLSLLLVVLLVLDRLMIVVLKLKPLLMFSHRSKTK